jgi:hypothetical protein
MVFLFKGQDRAVRLCEAPEVIVQKQQRMQQF